MASAEWRRLCFYLCLSVCMLDYSKSHECILMKFFGEARHGPRNNQYDFDSDPNLELGIFRRVFWWNFFDGEAWSKDQTIRLWWQSRSQSGSRNFLKGFFICYSDSYRQPSIKRENPWWRFTLSQCFLDIAVIVIKIIWNEQKRWVAQ